jgi:hypothetical protein
LATSTPLHRIPRRQKVRSGDRARILSPSRGKVKHVPLLQYQASGAHKGRGLGSAGCFVYMSLCGALTPEPLRAAETPYPMTGQQLRGRGVSEQKSHVPMQVTVRPGQGGRPAWRAAPDFEDSSISPTNFVCQSALQHGWRVRLCPLACSDSSLSRRKVRGLLRLRIRLFTGRESV